MFIVSTLLTFSLFPTIIINAQNTSSCTCVPFHQCLDEDTKFDGSGLLDIRKLEATDQCTGHFDVCCKNITQENSVEKTPNGCGYQYSGFFPWSASLLFRTHQKAPYTSRCGVSLINKKAVITAAHCLDEEGLWSVRLGNIVRSVAKKLIHPLYNEATLHNDIAILILSSPLPTTKKITQICIPPRGTIFNSTTCNTPTWVKSTNGHKQYSYLSMVTLPVVPRQKCIETLRETRLGPLFQLHQSFLCAGGNSRQDSCEGNGGNPLVCPVPGQPGRYHQIGIVSWGIGCGENVPGVYVKLSEFRDWIDEEMGRNGLEIAAYRY